MNIARITNNAIHIIAYFFEIASVLIKKYKKNYEVNYDRG